MPHLLIRAATKQAEQVYVCMQCGRQSWDRQGIQTLVSGWSRSCTQAAVKLPISALQVNALGVVTGISKRALISVRETALRAAN